MGKTKDVTKTKNQQLNLFVVPINAGGNVIVKMLGLGQIGKIKQEFVIEVVVSITWTWGMNVFGQPGNHGHIAVKLVVMDLREERNITNLIPVFKELVQDQVKKKGVATKDLVMKLWILI